MMLTWLGITVECVKISGEDIFYEILLVRQTE